VVFNDLSILAGEEEGSGSEMSSGEAEARLPGISSAVAAAGGGARKRRQPEQEERESDGAGEGSSEESDAEEGDASEREDLVFPAEFAPALVQLLATAPDAAEQGGSSAGAQSGQPKVVRDIALPDGELRLQVATALWEAGMLRTLPPEEAQQPKKGGSKQTAGGKHKGGSKQAQQQTAEQQNKQSAGSMQRSSAEQRQLQHKQNGKAPAAVPKSTPKSAKKRKS
jgi:hypothetical protein